MKNYLQDGDVISYAPSSAVASGAAIAIGTLLGVAVNDVAANATGEFMIEGVFTLPKLSTAVIAVGDRLAWDIDSSPPQFIVASMASGDLLRVAVAVAAAGSGPTTVAAKLTPESGSVAGVAGGTDTSITNLNAWATALATKLNADAGVTDANYDTDPQT